MECVRRTVLPNVNVYNVRDWGRMPVKEIKVVALLADFQITAKTTITIEHNSTWL